MSRLSASLYYFLALVALVCVCRVCKSIDHLTTALHESCLVGDGSPPKYLNDPNRKPFSFRNKVEKPRAR